MGQTRSAYRIFAGSSTGNIPMRRPKRRWMDVKMDLTELGWGDVDWNHLAQGGDQWRDLVNTVMNFLAP
jgi:hypothetical protein